NSGAVPHARRRKRAGAFQVEPLDERTTCDKKPRRLQPGARDLRGDPIGLTGPCARMPVASPPALGRPAPATARRARGAPHPAAPDTTAPTVPRAALSWRGAA